MEQLAALLFGIAIGFLPSATFVYFLQELRSVGWTKNSSVAIGMTIALLGGESWVAGGAATYLFEQGGGNLIVLGLSGIFIVSAVAAYIRYLARSLSE